MCQLNFPQKNFEAFKQVKIYELLQASQLYSPPFKYLVYKIQSKSYK